MTAGATRGPNFAVLAGLAWLVIAIDLVARHWAGTALTLSDTDDAMRLAQLHDFLNGQGWFDMHQTRLAPPAGYDSHWSRLIDAGLAGTFLLFHQFVDAALAERLMRVVWPLLWLMPAILGVALTAWRLAGRDAAVVTLLLCVVGLPAFQQFLPGRIDHHNAQIALSVAIVAAAAWSDRDRGRRAQRARARDRAGEPCLRGACRRGPLVALRGRSCGFAGACALRPRP